MAPMGLKKEGKKGWAKLLIIIISASVDCGL